MAGDFDRAALVAVQNERAHYLQAHTWLLKIGDIPNPREDFVQSWLNMCAYMIIEIRSRVASIASQLKAYRDASCAAQLHLSRVFGSTPLPNENNIAQICEVLALRTRVVQELIQAHHTSISNLEGSFETIRGWLRGITPADLEQILKKEQIAHQKTAEFLLSPEGDANPSNGVTGPEVGGERDIDQQDVRELTDTLQLQQDHGSTSARQDSPEQDTRGDMVDDSSSTSSIPDVLMREASEDRSDDAGQRDLPSTQNATADESTRITDKFSYTDEDLEKGTFCAACTITRCTTMMFNCSHFYCDDCLSHQSKLAAAQRKTVRCCKQEAPLHLAKLHLDEDEYEQYELRWRGIKNPVYCAGSCTKRLLGERVSKALAQRCTTCQVETCMRCEETGHEGVCDIDGNDGPLKLLAAQMGWKVCPDCSRMIELIDGCAHVECLCGGEFCYECGQLYQDYDGRCRCEC